MEESLKPLSPWTQRDRDALQLAMVAKGHGQRECAERLKALGSKGANQSTVSKWASGSIARPHQKTVLAIRAYVQEAFPRGVPDTSEAREPPAAPDQEHQFEDTVRGITNEPLLGPRQAELVDAVTLRIREGPPLTEADERQLAEQRRILGLA